MAKDLNTKFDHQISINGVLEYQGDQAAVAYLRPEDVASEYSLAGEFEGRPAYKIRVIDDGMFQDLLDSGDVKPVSMPADAKARRDFIAEWVKAAARKNKKGLIPFLLLPLAACGGGGSKSEVTEDFDVKETSDGVFEIGNGRNDVDLFQENGVYFFAPDTGDQKTVETSGVSELVVTSGTLEASVVDLHTNAGTQAISGAGRVALTATATDVDLDLSPIVVSGGKALAVLADLTLDSSADLGDGFEVFVDYGFTLTGSATQLSGQDVAGLGAVVVGGDLASDLSVDLSHITSSGGISAVVSDGVFMSNANFGAATVTIDGVVDLQAMGVDGADGASFVLLASGNLIVTHAQIDAISEMGAITGAGGSVTIIAGNSSSPSVGSLTEDSPGTATVLVNVDVDGGGCDIRPAVGRQ